MYVLCIQYHGKPGKTGKPKSVMKTLWKSESVCGRRIIVSLNHDKQLYGHFS